ncbi:MAG: 3-deoxy-D-manno-octulosonate 8-phosphate phosphatase (KDO 8-P phosphatase) [Flavobacteriales bacterium]|jgi:3-deoxy-D-manno-octulosonate 8-phosphate phosphatase (KDO 8-P phosphatase)
MPKNYKELLNEVKAFVFDVDGVFTDGTVLIQENGDQLRRMNVKDGYAVQHAFKAGYPIGIISGGKSEGVRKRFQYLGLEDIYLGVSNKTEALNDFCFKHKITTDNVLYIGDDIPDLKVMEQCLLAACPSDAAIEVKNIAQYISPNKGGNGTVRDVISQVMKVQGKWLKSTEKDSLCSI